MVDHPIRCRRIRLLARKRLQVVVEESDGDLMGNGVNIAARSITAAGGVRANSRAVPVVLEREFTLSADPKRDRRRQCDLNSVVSSARPSAHSWACPIPAFCTRGFTLGNQ